MTGKTILPLMLALVLAGAQDWALAPAGAQAADPAILELKSRMIRLEGEVRGLSAARRPPAVAGADESLRQRLRTLELSVAAMQHEINGLKAALAAAGGGPARQ